MDRRCLARCLLLALLASGLGIAATPPDWTKPYLDEDNSKWTHGSAVLRLLVSREVRYLASDRVRIQTRLIERVLNESGLDRARMRQLYNGDYAKVVSINAWIISADGRKTQSFGPREFVDRVAQVSDHFWNARRFVGFDASSRMEIGGVLVIEFVVEQPAGFFTPSFSFLNSEPTVHTVFEVIPAPGAGLEWFASSDKMLRPVPGREPGSLRWEGARLHAQGDGQPTRFIPNPLIVSVRSAAGGSPAFPLSSWKDFARQVADLIEPRTTVSPELKAKAEAVVAGKTGRWERIRALTEFIQGNVTYLSLTLDKDSLAGYRPHAAADVLRDRYGDCKDKATLLAAMLRAIGDNGYVILVYSGNPRAVMPDWPSASFNHAIVVIPADDQVPASWPVVDGGPLGRLVVFDATDSACPLGTLSAGDQGGYGLIASAGQEGLVRLPVETPSLARLERQTQAVLEATGRLRASVEETYFGTTAATVQRQRSAARNAGFTRTMEARLHETLPLVQDLHWTDKWDPLGAQYRLSFDFVTEKYARKVGPDRLMVSPQILGGGASPDPWKTQVEGTVWQPPTGLHDLLRLVLPEGFSMEDTPEPYSRSLDGISCELAFRAEGSVLVFESRFEQTAGFLDKADYEARRRFIQEYREALRRPCMIRRQPGAAAP